MSSSNSLTIPKEMASQILSLDNKCTSEVDIGLTQQLKRMVVNSEDDSAAGLLERARSNSKKNGDSNDKLKFIKPKPRNSSTSPHCLTNIKLIEHDIFSSLGIEWHPPADHIRMEQPIVIDEDPVFSIDLDNLLNQVIGTQQPDQDQCAQTSYCNLLNECSSTPEMTREPMLPQQTISVQPHKHIIEQFEKEDDEALGFWKSSCSSGSENKQITVCTNPVMPSKKTMDNLRKKIKSKDQQSQTHDIYYKNENNETRLHIYAKTNDELTVKTNLIQYEDDHRLEEVLGIVSKYGETVLSHFVNYENLSMVEFLIKKGADPFIIFLDYENLFTRLCYKIAAEGRQATLLMLQTLLEASNMESAEKLCKLLNRNNNGKTPFQILMDATYSSDFHKKILQNGLNLLKKYQQPDQKLKINNAEAAYMPKYI